MLYQQLKGWSIVLRITSRIYNKKYKNVCYERLIIVYPYYHSECTIVNRKLLQSIGVHRSLDLLLLSYLICV